MNILEKSIRAIGGVLNSSLLSYFRKYGATSNVLQDAEKEYLRNKLGNTFIASQDAWKSLDSSYGGALPLEASDILKSYGANAHMYLPGVGSNIGGFNPGNYQDSAGTTAAVVDGPVGLVLDAAGSVGPTFGAFSVQSGFDNVITASTKTSFSTTAGATAARVFANFPTVVGVTYTLRGVFLTAGAGGVVIYARSGYNVGGSIIANTATIAQSVPFIFSFVATTETSCFLFVGYTAAQSFSATGLTLITGIHASQATAGYKPVERKGIVNLLLNSAAPATQTVSLAVGTYTLSLIGTGSVVITGLGAGTLTGTGASDLVTLTFSVAVAGAVIFTKSGSVTSFGLFQGTITAAQILAYGGIPLTTTAAASSVNGPYYLAFDGGDDRLTAATPAFQAADDYVVVCAFSFTEAAGTYVVFTQGTGSSRCPVIYTLGGSLIAGWRDDVAAGASITMATTEANKVYVATAIKSGGTVSARLNGVSKGSTSYVGGTTTIGGMYIGSTPAGAAYVKGNIYDVIPIKGTLSDAEITLLENQAAASAGGRLVAGAFVSNY